MQKNLQIFCNPFLQTQSMKTSRDCTPSVIPFWKPPMTPNWNPNSDAKFLQPHYTHTYKDPKGYNFLKSWPYPLTHTLLTLPLPLTISPPTPYPYPFYPLTIYLGCDFIDTSLVSLSKVTLLIVTHNSISIII